MSVNPIYVVLFTLGLSYLATHWTAAKYQQDLEALEDKLFCSLNTDNTKLFLLAFLGSFIAIGYQVAWALLFNNSAMLNFSRYAALVFGAYAGYVTTSFSDINSSTPQTIKLIGIISALAVSVYVASSMGHSPSAC